MSKITDFVNSKRRQSEEEDTTALVKSPAARFFGLVALTIIMIGTLFPFYWMIRTALSTNKSMFSDATSLVPVDFTLGAINRVLGIATSQEAIAEGGSGGQINFLHYMGNSLVVCTMIVACQIIFGALAAYAFAILEWRGRNTVFTIFLVALMVPGIFTILPNFLLIKELGLLNTYLGIALPAMFMAPFSVFFLRQFFLGINRSLIEAATIDGASHFKIFRSIALPIVLPQVLTLAILQFILYWNDYLWPFLVGQSEDSKLLTVGLGIFKSQTPQGNPDWAGLMAGALIAAVPIIIIFMIFGRRIVGSIQSSGVK